MSGSRESAGQGGDKHGPGGQARVESRRGRTFPRLIAGGTSSHGMRVSALPKEGKGQDAQESIPRLGRESSSGRRGPRNRGTRWRGDPAGPGPRGPVPKLCSALALFCKSSQPLPCPSSREERIRTLDGPQKPSAIRTRALGSPQSPRSRAYRVGLSLFPLPPEWLTWVRF